MANIENRGKGSWRITVSGGYGPDGRQIRVRRTFQADPSSTINSQRKQAEKYAAKLESDFADQKVNNAKKLSLAGIYEDYIDDRIIRKGLAARTEDSYRDLFDRRINPQLGKKAIREITPQDLNLFFRKMTKEGLAGTYQLKFYQQLNEIMKYAQRTGIIVTNPCSLIEPPKRDTQEAQFYEMDECADIMNALDECDDPEWKAYFILALYCGTRPGEQIGLDWSDYDGTDIFIRSGSYRGKGKNTIRTDKPKTRKSIRKIKLPQIAIDALNAWRIAQKKLQLKFEGLWPEPDAIFTNALGQRLGPDRPSRYWKRFTKKHNLRYLPPYDFRHTSCSLLISSKELSIEEISARMGHQQSSTTLNFYSHVFAGANEKATAAIETMVDKAKSNRKNA